MRSHCGEKIVMAGVGEFEFLAYFLHNSANCLVMNIANSWKQMVFNLKI